MSIINVIRTIKKIHSDSVILVKVGMFYNVYGRDSYILSYLFGYKLKQFQNTYICGFPLDSISKVMAKLENKKINYIIVDRRNSYDVDEKTDFGNVDKIEISENKEITIYYKFNILNMGNKDKLKDVG